MLSYPPILTYATEYDELRIGPEASGEEIRDAQRDLIERLRAELASAQKELDRITTHFDGFAETLRRLASLSKLHNADPDELKAVRIRLFELEEKARRFSPDYEDCKNRVKDIENRIKAVNRMRILKDRRADYDHEHPPFELLKLADCSRDRFVLDHVLLLWNVRVGVARFLSERGESVFHPSDLTRPDFSSDFSRNPNLDD